jgi:hypothetical protein
MLKRERERERKERDEECEMSDKLFSDRLEWFEKQTTLISVTILSTIDHLPKKAAITSRH